MTIEERVNKALDAMGDDCYVFCCSEAESAYRDGFTDGANDQKKIDIEKAWSWIDANTNLVGLRNELNRRFKKAMEE